MRWLKHMVATRDDEKVAALVAKSGAEGYGLWWMVLETIAASMDKNSDKCSLNYPLSKWAATLQVLPQNVCRQVAVMGAVGLLSIRRDGAMLEITAHNLLKYRDEWSSRKETTREFLGSKQQIQIQSIDTDTEEPPKPPAPDGAYVPVREVIEPIKAALQKPRTRKGKRTTEQVRNALGERTVWFDSLWEVGPWKDDKLSGMDTYERRVTDVELAREIHKGAIRYAAKCAADPTTRVKFLQGWLNDERWTDANESPPPAVSNGRKSFVDDVERAIKQNLEETGLPWR